jgi:hypothetical protein
MRNWQMVAAIATTAGMLVVILLSVRRTFGRNATWIIGVVTLVVVAVVVLLLLLS